MIAHPFRFRGGLMNSTIENFVDRYNPGVTSLLTRLSVAIENSERELEGCA